MAHRPLSARPNLTSSSPYSHEARFTSMNRQRSTSAVALPHNDLGRAAQGFISIPGGVAGLNSEAQHIWESLMTLHCSRYTPLSTHLARALPLLTHPSLPLPAALQILIFTSSLAPSLRALILSQHPHLDTLDEAVGAARLAERAKQRMDWIGRTMTALEVTSPQSSPMPSVLHRPSPPRTSSSRPSSSSYSGGWSRPSTGTTGTTPSPSFSRAPWSSRKRSYDDDEPRVRSHRRKKVKMHLTCDANCTRHDHDHGLDEDRPGSSESSVASDKSPQSGMDALADAAVEAAREQLQRL
ncbi:hypothetical protein DACRYDRAFT_119826 [Dacryopinax primogenitus]|uniref:Uncharacterized protein n=1 Tax=Dacryopinax primogenitus (strain DJM 731) TaxID=1858805 RepID=M5FN93_DACPD|nr:uncharacterized protein DACRYDRAFT_119826 [Dacryopinax primogenitus]EJT97045.1 hypothetical protein DACRYDRAFT_119826 [Dacryopinax primogenitus]